MQIAETCCNQAMSLGKRVHVSLRDVSVVDEAGFAMLRRLAASGCALHGRGLYTSHIVQMLRPVMPKTAGNGRAAQFKESAPQNGPLPNVRAAINHK